MKTLFRLSFLIAAMLLAYSNHWHNSFHFDDWHTITQNKNIRKVTPLKFLLDGRTSSTLPTNQNYRPLNTFLLSLDYKIGGYDTFGYHVQSFAWFVLLVVLIYFFFAPMVGEGAALFGAALFGLHPVCAETVNYLCQRGEIVAACGVVLAVSMLRSYSSPALRWTVTALALVASLAKITALVFFGIIIAHEVITQNVAWRLLWKHWCGQFAACAVMIIFQWRMTPHTYTTGGTNAFQYWLTQPVVAVHYLKQFLLPTELSADTDRMLVPYLLHEQFIIGAAFVFLLVWFVWDSIAHTRASSGEQPVVTDIEEGWQWRVIKTSEGTWKYEQRFPAFGIAWFLICMIPTSVAPLSEVENDHRIFLPMIGLCLSSAWLAKRIYQRWPKQSPWAALALFALMIVGTHQRNFVWHNEETLWTDVVIKSPHNGRGLMNYGNVLASKGDFNGALQMYALAEYWVPFYPILKTNEGIALGAMGRDGEAESRFIEAIRLSPRDAQVHWLFARFLRSRGKTAAADTEAKLAREINGAWIDSL